MRSRCSESEEGLLCMELSRVHVFEDCIESYCDHLLCTKGGFATSGHTDIAHHRTSFGVLTTATHKKLRRSI